MGRDQYLANVSEDDLRIYNRARAGAAVLAVWLVSMLIVLAPAQPTGEAAATDGVAAVEAGLQKVIAER